MREGTNIIFAIISIKFGLYRRPKILLYCLFNINTQIIVPVNHGFAHWYLLVVSVQEHCAEIWDPVSSSLTSNLFVTEVQEIVSYAFVF